jgi:hypothetical protein
LNNKQILSVDVLERVLAKTRLYHAEYKGTLSNHLPMAIVALFRIGANEETLEAFYQAYLAKLTPKDSLLEQAPVLTCDDWNIALGRRTPLESFERFFGEEYERIGQHELLRLYLPTLLEGMLGGGFHGLIQLGYALDINRRAEIVNGFAYMAYAHLVPEGLLTERNKEVAWPVMASFLDKTKSTLSFKAFKLTIAAKKIYGKIEAIGSLADIRAQCEGVYLNDDSRLMMDQLSELSLELYLLTSDFTALHLITGLHALRLALEPLDSTERLKALQNYFHLFCLAYLSIGENKTTVAAALEDLQSYRALSWETLFTKARDSKDPHVIKLIYTCYEENCFYSKDQYRLIAARRLFQ